MALISDAAATVARVRPSEVGWCGHLRLVGAGRSYDEIAEDLGCASRGSARRLVTNALKSTMNDVA